MEEAATWLDILDKAVIPMVAVLAALAGALLTAVLGRRNEERRMRLQLRREVYFEAVDAGLALLDAMRDMTANSPYGSTDPDADAAAATAIDRAMGIYFSLPRIEARIAIAGTQAALDASIRCRESTDQYVSAIGEQIRGDGVFRGGVAVDYMKDLESSVHLLANVARSDLRTGGRIRLKSAFPEIDNERPLI